MHRGVHISSACVVLLVCIVSADPQEGVTIHITGPARIIITNPESSTNQQGHEASTAEQCTGGDGFCVETGDRCNATIKLLQNSCYDHCACCVSETQVPGPVDYLDAIPMGNSALFLIWKPPKRPNGILTGYNIYFQEVQGTQILDVSERDPQINDPRVTRAKLAALKPATKYRITITANNVVGKGETYYIERSTRSTGPTPPGNPSFIWQYITNPDGRRAIRINWIPNPTSNTGSHFYVQYRLYGDALFQKTKLELYNDFTVLKGLEDQNIYEVRVVSVDGEYETPSVIEEIQTSTYY